MNENNAELLKQLKQITLMEEERYTIENSKDNRKIIRIKLEDKHLYLGSKYAVNRDVDSFMSAIKGRNGNSIIIIWGFGTGEHILDLLKETSNNNVIIIIEPDEKVLIENIISNNAESVFEFEKVFITNYKKGNIKKLLSQNIKDVEINNIKIAAFGNYDKVYNKEYNEFSTEFIEFINDSIIGINTALYFAKTYFKCFANNIDKIVESTMINQLKDKFKGKTAITVSAGPSLEKNIDLLKTIQDKFIIITGGRTLKTLLDRGIKPDFVCSVDPGEGSFMVIEKALQTEIPLVFSEVSNYKVVKEYKGKKIFFNDIDFRDITDQLLEVEVDCLWQGGSVAHVCISLAVYLGCDNVIFIGQDLAYTNNKYHAETASIADNNNIEEDTYIYVEDIYGELVPTTIPLEFYRKKLEEMIPEYEDVIFINSTEGGANIKGTVIKPLSQSIYEYASTYSLDKNIEDILNKETIVDKKTVYKNIKEVLNSIQSIKEICKDALSQTSRMYKYYDKNASYDINSILKRLDELDLILNGEVEKTQSIKKLYAPLMAKILISDEFEEKHGENEKERGKRLAKKSEAMYSGILEIMEEAKNEFEEIIKSLE